MRRSPRRRRARPRRRPPPLRRPRRTPTLTGWTLRSRWRSSRSVVSLSTRLPFPLPSLTPDLNSARRRRPWLLRLKRTHGKAQGHERSAVRVCISVAVGFRAQHLSNQAGTQGGADSCPRLTMCRVHHRSLALTHLSLQGRQAGEEGAAGLLRRDGHDPGHGPGGRRRCSGGAARQGGGRSCGQRRRHAGRAVAHGAPHRCRRRALGFRVCEDS